MLAVVLAAGRGTRLGPLTARRSKAMMPVAGRPMIDRVLDMLRDGGVSQAIVVAHAEDDDLTSFLASRRKDTVDIVYQEERLGMAHALACAAPSIRRRAVREFVLSSCDNLYPDDHLPALIQARREADADAAVTLMWAPPREARSSAAAIVQDGWVVDLVEKPTVAQVDSLAEHDLVVTVPSVYALRTRILDYVPWVTPSRRGELEFVDVLRACIAAGGKVSGQHVQSRCSLTTPQDLLALNRHILRSQPACRTVAAELPPAATVEHPVQIEAGASVGPGSTVGPEVFLESGSRVGPNATVRRSVVLAGGRVGPEEHVEEAVVGRFGLIL